MPPDRWFGNRVVSLVTSLRVGQRINDPSCGYRGMDATILADLPYEDFSNDHRILVDELLAFDRYGASIEEVPIPCIYEDEVSTLSYYDGIKFLYPSLTWWR